MVWDQHVLLNGPCCLGSIASVLLSAGKMAAQVETDSHMSGRKIGDRMSRLTKSKEEGGSTHTNKVIPAAKRREGDNNSALTVKLLKKSATSTKYMLTERHVPVNT